MISEVWVNDEVVEKAFQRAPGVMVKTMDRAVQRAAMVLGVAIQKELRANKSLAFSTLINSIHADKPALGVRDVRAGVKYAPFVEDGTRGGYRALPPVRSLAEWIRIKTNVTEREAKRRAFGLARFIAIHGTKAHPFMKPAFEKTESRLMQILRDGAAEGVQQVLREKGHYAFTGSRFL